MAILKSVGEFFAIDIGTKSVRVAQLSGSGDKWSLLRFGYAPIDMQASLAAGNTEASRRLGEIITTAIGQSGITTKNVVVGIPSNKSFTTVIDLPVMSDSELRSTIRYQLDKYIPMSIDEAQVDWFQLGQSMRDPKQQEVLLASTAKAYAEERLEFIESLGLNVVAMEPEPIAMVRSLLASNAEGAQLMIDFGEISTNIVLTFQGAPRLVRTIPTGLATLTKSASQNLAVSEDQARQFLLKFGLAPDRLEGRVLNAVEPILESFSQEINKSIQFFKSRSPDIAVSNIMYTSYATSVPQFAEYVSNKTGVPGQHANPWLKVNVSQKHQQQLAAISHEFAVVIGLAQRGKVV